LEQQRADEKKKKEAEKKTKSDLDNLFKPVIQQAKVSKGSVLAREASLSFAQTITIKFG